jgi:hypothetical protein
MGKKLIGDCIYGHKNVELSGEHYLPRCLGRFRGFEMLNDRVCVSCNNSFGQLEEQFCRTGPEAFFRYRAGVEGYKHHEKVNPFRRGSAGAERMRLEGKFPGEEFDVLWEPNKGAETIDYMTQIILFTDSGTFHIPIPDNMTDPSQLKAEFEKLGITFAKEARILAPESEIPRIESLLAGMKHEGSIEWQRSPEKGTIYGVTMANVTGKYFRALAKIAFHYFLKQTNRFRGDEDAFADIRQFITHGGDYTQFVKSDLNQIVWQGPDGYGPANYVHFIAARVNEKRIWSHLQFFLRGDYEAPVHTINLGVNPSSVIYDETYGHSFEYYESREQDGYDGVMKEATAVRKSLLP